MLENEITQPSKFGAKIGIKINDVARGMYYQISEIKLKATIWKLKSCHYSDT